MDIESTEGVSEIRITIIFATGERFIVGADDKFEMYWGGEGGRYFEGSAQSSDFPLNGADLGLSYLRASAQTIALPLSYGMRFKHRRDVLVSIDNLWIQIFDEANPYVDSAVLFAVSGYPAPTSATSTSMETSTEVSTETSTEAFSTTTVTFSEPELLATTSPTVSTPSDLSTETTTFSSSTLEPSSPDVSPSRLRYDYWHLNNILPISNTDSYCRLVTIRVPDHNSDDVRHGSKQQHGRFDEPIKDGNIPWRNNNAHDHSNIIG
ncbi:hypothetical protein CGLO_15821 [Colletotrichum gloeosporioides Cg-14]|uniref:Uncharacterized protein n=1 Tax=Colletotrichum gloeosporioides (strain Cg-14) TaxID=1237896 RepID=T0L1A4_COLGC|nr:hypothetical protein CGLO_15821 [Colletotrichum gloeosporioides Cg-14]